jgi:hypothetical protein
VSDVRGELGDEIQVVELSGGAFVSFLLEGVYARLMVSEDSEVTHFQHVAEVPNGLVDGQEFSVVRAVLPLCGVELP